MSQSIVDELITLLGFKVDPQANPTLHKFTSLVDSVGKTATVAGAAIMGAAASLLYFAEKSAGAGAEIERFHQLTGMSTDAIQQWGYAAQQVSGHKESILNDIERITTQLNPIMPGEFNQGMFLFFGDKLKSIKDTNTALREMAKIFPRLSEQKALQWGNLMGLTPETVLLLRQGNAGIDQLFAKTRGRLLTPQDTKDALRFAQLWDDIKDRATKFAERVGIRLLPSIGKVLTLMIKWWESNEKLISSGLDRFIEGVSRGVNGFVRILGSLRKELPYGEKLFSMIADPRVIGGGVQAALFGIAGVLGLIAGKYVAIGLAAYAALTASQDFIDTIKGGKDTVMGRFDGYMKVLGMLDSLGYYSWDDIKKAWNEAGETFTTGGENAGKPASNMMEVLGMLKGMIKSGAISGNQANMAYLEQTGTDPKLLSRLYEAQGNKNVTFHQSNQISIQSTDPYTAGEETMFRLQRLQRTDFSTMGLASPVN